MLLLVDIRAILDSQQKCMKAIMISRVLLPHTGSPYCEHPLPEWYVGYKNEFIPAHHYHRSTWFMLESTLGILHSTNLNM